MQLERYFMVCNRNMIDLKLNKYAFINRYVTINNNMFYNSSCVLFMWEEILMDMFMQGFLLILFLYCHII